MAPSSSGGASSFQQSVHARELRRARAERRIIFANGDHVSVLRIPPFVGALLVLVMLAGAVGIIGSASYLFFRDELFTASIKRQHQIQVAYEDRISELRREIDRITSRQLLNQQAYEARVERLLAEHHALSSQTARLDVLLDQAGQLGLVPRQAPPAPVVPPNGANRFGSAAQASSYLADDDLITGSIPLLPTERNLGLLDQAVAAPGAMLTAIEDALDAQAHNQVIALASLTATTNAKVDAITDNLQRLGVRVSLPSAGLASAADTVRSQEEAGVGGPLIPALDEDTQFAIYAEDTARALEDLDAARAAISLVPVASPARGARLTSRFGNRRDPFTRRTAFHSGIDYAAPIGHPVYAPADGVVSSARRAGGYGLMIEIDHPNGLSTRFAHLSGMMVSAGDRVRAGEQIGRIGSTGRSTGPHLHYEIRRGSRAIDPMPFVQAGQVLRDL